MTSPYVVAALLALLTVAEISHAEPETRYRGFGEFLLSHYDYPENFYRDREDGPDRDHRLAADVSQLSLTGLKPLANDVALEFEIRVDHLGVAGQSEPNFGGPFNDEHHGGADQGAVRMSKLLLAKHFGDSFSLQGGKIPVAFGAQPQVESPTDYLGTRPFESEHHFIPEEWAELGVALIFEGETLASTTEIVNGLDSTGFGSYRFVAEGRQERYGSVRATEPALVQRLDATLNPAFRTGASLYYGETSQNRPTPDLVRDCDDADDDGSDKVAPCGYVHAPLTMLDWHGEVDAGRWRGTGLLLWGHLKNAAAVNDANRRDSTNLPDFFTPVAEKAVAGSGELGFNVASDPTNEHSELFLRFDRINTQWRNPGGETALAVSDRAIGTAGFSWHGKSSVYAKADYSRRRFTSDRISYESTLTLVTGFKF